MLLLVAHKVCSEGQWTEAAGYGTKDTKCTACSAGRFRVKAPTDGKAEKEGDVCISHRKCKRGEWTRLTGTSVSDTTCVPCKPGTFRANGASSTRAEQEVDVCVAHLHKVHGV